MRLKTTFASTSLILSLLACIGISNSQEAHAATNETAVSGTVSVIYSGPGKVRLLDQDGKYQEQYVDKNSQWKAFSKADINNAQMYRIGSQKQWIPAQYTEFKDNVSGKIVDNSIPAGQEEAYNHVIKVNYTGAGGVRLLNNKGEYQNQVVKKNSAWRAFAKANINNMLMYRIGSENQWIPSQYAAPVSNYQNPAEYYQVQYSQIKPTGQVGYTIGRNYEGIKTWLVMRKLGTYNGYANYNQATYNAVRNFQARHGLRVTGNVDVNTWTKLGFSKSSFYGIDNYIAPLGAQAWQDRSAHIEAMINQAYKYLGKPYIVGASSSPEYGTDCSGLVMQALYAGGINPTSASSIHHATPGNEWNSRNLFADKKLKSVPYSERQRGDLIFYYQPGTRTIWHVAIYLGNNKVIESWPPQIMVQPIINGQRNIIAGVKRPFI